ncbi:unnamed protein product [Strongylus vulgaris]|uniref:Uncharacterized protein n=1 Tax=Strongylus vulgaris TaxID=40348 RepID=A0A3P7J0K3_STRVU|nr:unnamed protein product [Strongylus vulgaris]
MFHIKDTLPLRPGIQPHPFQFRYGIPRNVCRQQDEVRRRRRPASIRQSYEVRVCPSSFIAFLAVGRACCKFVQPVPPTSSPPPPSLWSEAGVEPSHLLAAPISISRMAQLSPGPFQPRRDVCNQHVRREKAAPFPRTGNRAQLKKSLFQRNLSISFYYRPTITLAQKFHLIRRIINGLRRHPFDVRSIFSRNNGRALAALLSEAISGTGRLFLVEREEGKVSEGLDDFFGRWTLWITVDVRARTFGKPRR